MKKALFAGNPDEKRLRFSSSICCLIWDTIHFFPDFVNTVAADVCPVPLPFGYLGSRIGAEQVITFGSIPGQYDVYVHDDGGNSAVKMLKKLYEGQLL